MLAPDFVMMRSYPLHFRSRPTLLLICIPLAAVLFFPTLYLILRATQVESEQARQYLTRTGTIHILARSLLLVFAVSLTSCLIGIPAAWLTTRTDLFARRFWTVALTVPLVIPSYVGAYALVAAIGPKGILQQWLEPLGIERLPSIYGFWGAWLSITLIAYPYVFLGVRAGLKGIDASLEEASQTLGYSNLLTFWRITLRQLIPSISAGVLLVSLYTLSDFGAVATMQYNVFTRAIYIRLSINLELAALLSLVLVMLTVLILLFATRSDRRRKFYTRRVNRKPKPVRLGRWQAVAQLFCALILLLALIIPIGVMLYWFINGLQHGNTLYDVIGPLQRSMRAAALAAAACGLIALPFVFLDVRFPHRISHLLNRSTYIGYAMPGIVVALAFVFLGANYLGEFNRFVGMQSYRNLGLLIFAYVVRFLSQAVGPSRAALLQVNPHLEESGLTLGRNQLRVFSSITLPLMRPGLIAGIALVFLTVLKELPVTLLLAPIGYDTLATRIWSANSEAFYSQAAAPALVLVFISMLSLVYILDSDD